MPLPSTSNVTNPLAFGYQAQISDGITDILLRLAVAPGRELSITTAPLSAQQVNTAQVPEEFRAEFDLKNEEKKLEQEEALSKQRLKEERKEKRKNKEKKNTD